MKEPKIITYIKGINESLPDLLFGIIVFGIICEILGMAFIKDKANFSIGLGIGVIVACMMAFHMAYTLNHAVEKNEKDAQGFAVVQNLLRYFFVIIVLGVLMLTNIGNPLACFAGIMGIKASAYFQPVWKRLIQKISFKRNK